MNIHRHSARFAGLRKLGKNDDAKGNAQAGMSALILIVVAVYMFAALIGDIGTELAAAQTDVSTAFPAAGKLLGLVMIVVVAGFLLKTWRQSSA